MPNHSPRLPQSSDQEPAIATDRPGKIARITSGDLFRHAREVEIDHEGRIYKLRLTQLNKLILTA